MANEISMDESYDEFPQIEEAFQRRLDESLKPTGPPDLLEMLVDATEIEHGQTLVDVGCGEGHDAIEIATRLGANVIAVDPVDRHLEIGAAAADKLELNDKVRFRKGKAEQLPVQNSSVDILFAKESLMYADLDIACVEARRVLRTGGYRFVYQVFTGEHMTDDEASRFWPMNAGARSVRPEDLERSIKSAGMQVTDRVNLSSQWGEYGQENSSTPGRRLAHVARLRRDPDRYIAEFGLSAYKIMLHDCLWHVYRMLGLLHGAIIVFKVPGPSSIDTR